MQPINSAARGAASSLGETLAHAGDSVGMVFQVGGLVSDTLGLFSKAKKSLKSYGWKFIDHTAKATDRLGGVISKVGFILESVHGFLPSAQAASHALKVAAPILVSVGTLLSGAALFNDARNAYKIRQFRKKLKVVQLNWQGAVNEKSFVLKDEAFKELVQLIQDSRPGIIRKSLGIDKADLHDLVKTMYTKRPSDEEMANLFKRLKARTSEQMRMQMVNVAFDVLGLASSILLIIPVTQPAGLALVAVCLCGSAYNVKYDIVEGHKFEQDIGTINSRYSKKKDVGLKKYAFDKLGISAIIKAFNIEDVEQPEFASKRAYVVPPYQPAAAAA